MSSTTKSDAVLWYDGRKTPSANIDKVLEQTHAEIVKEDGAAIGGVIKRRAYGRFDNPAMPNFDVIAEEIERGLATKLYEDECREWRSRGGSTRRPERRYLWC